MNRHAALVLILTLAMAGCTLPGRFMRGYAEGRPAGFDQTLEAVDAAGSDPVARGMTHLLFDDWGSFNTDGLNYHTLPWKVVTTGIILRAHEEDDRPITLETMDEILAGMGFIEPTRVANWVGPELELDGPIGLLRGTIARGFPGVELEVANVGCAGCHAGRTYDARGFATNEVWLGLPNTSINLDSYAVAIFEGLRQWQGREDRFWAVFDQLFPETSERERGTIDAHALPRITERFEADWAGQRSALPFVNGSSGLTNGVAEIKNLLGMLQGDASDIEVGYTSIPDLGARHLRSSLLYDGVYGAAGRPRFEAISDDDVTETQLNAVTDMITFFVVPTLGVEPDRARDGWTAMRHAVDFIRVTRSPPFPGEIDTARAEEGERLFRARCARCHGSFSPGIEAPRLEQFPNRLVPMEEIGTDPSRGRLATPELGEAIARTGYGKYLDASETGGYVAPPLTAVWATAPYLHNGSVPTIWHLLRPEERPDRFMVGGHRLDFERLGIMGAADESGVYRYPESYDPWATPTLYDTSRPGMWNTGHLAPSRGLTDDQVYALIEYLKVL